MSSIFRIIFKALGKGVSRKLTDKHIDNLSEKEAKKVIDVNQQFEYVLRVPKFTKVAIIVSFIVVTCGLSYAIFDMVKRGTEFNADSIAGLSILGVCVVLLIPFYYVQKNKYVSLSNSLVESYTPFKKHIEFRWSDIDKVEFLGNKVMNFYCKGEKVTIFKAYTGSGLALRLLFQRVDINLYIYQLLQNQTYSKLLLSILTESEKEVFIAKYNELIG